MEIVDFKKMIKKRIKIWTILSTTFPIALPLMIIALVNDNWFLAIPMIVIVTFDVIALPIGWTFLGFLIKEKGVAEAIVNDQVYHIRDLAIMLGSTDKIIKDRVITIISNRYITGYKFNPQGTELIYLNDDTIHKGLCKYCNGPLPHKARNCPYCNGLVE